MKKEAPQTPQANDHQPQHDPDRQYVLSEPAKAAIWAELARITPALHQAAAKVLTWLTSEALTEGKLSIRASCRDVAAGAGCAKSNTIIGTKELVALRLIAKREGTATRPAAYILRYAETLKMGGPVAGPPVERFPQNQQDHRGPVAGPPKNGDLQHCATLFDLDPDVLSIDSKVLSKGNSSIDRSGDPLPIDPEAAKKCTGLMQLFVQHQLRWTNPHPPDSKIVGVMLRVAEWPTVERFLTAAVRGDGPKAPERVGQPYAWLVSVALNHIHGLQPDEQKPTLELLRGGRQMFSKWHTEGLK